MVYTLWVADSSEGGRFRAAGVLVSFESAVAVVGGILIGALGEMLPWVVLAAGIKCSRSQRDGEGGSLAVDLVVVEIGTGGAT